MVNETPASSVSSGSPAVVGSDRRLTESFVTTLSSTENFASPVVASVAGGFVASPAGVVASPVGWPAPASDVWTGRLASDVTVAVGFSGVMTIATALVDVAPGELPSSPISVEAQYQKRPSRSSKPTTGRITRR